VAWIELHQSLWTHRKTLIMAVALNLDETYAAAHMARLWTWALDNAPQGDLTGLPNEVIARGAGWKGDPDEFVAAAIKAGFLEKIDGALQLHDWEDYAGRLIERRAAERERSRQRREAARTVSMQPSGVQQTTAGRPPVDRQVSDGTVPNSTVQYRTNTVEADSRVDSKSGGLEGGTGETSQPPSPPDVTPTERAVLGELKAVPQYPFDYQKDLEHIRDLATDFPDIDLLQEVKKWRAYKRDRPLEAKSNPRLQLRNWCEIAHKRLGERMARDKPRGKPWDSAGGFAGGVEPGHAPPEVKAYIESSLAAFMARKEAMTGGAGGSS